MRPKREHIGDDIEALIERGNITEAEDAELRCNSYERQAMVPALTDEALLWRMRHCVANCFFSQRVPASTYNKALGTVYVPELIARFERFLKARP